MSRTARQRHLSENVAVSPEMVRIAGGKFRMGSDHHYPEERPLHRVTVDGFVIDATPVTNAQFRAFVKATGLVTVAEIAPSQEDYPGARPEMLKADWAVIYPFEEKQVVAARFRH